MCIAATLALALTGCYRGAINEREPATESAPIIVPPEMETSGGGTVVALFYQYMGEPLLAPQTVALYERSDRTLEELAVRKLLEGPPTARSDLSALFAPGVELLEARLQGDELSLFFNASFTEPPADMNLPVDWEEIPEWEERVAQRRRLATYSIVNTVTQMGDVRRVLFKVDEYGDGKYDRVNSRHLGLGGEAISEAVERDARYILTPQTAAETALKCMADRDYTRLERYVAEKGLTGQTRPVREDMAAALSLLPQLVNYGLSNNNNTFISSDGACAVLEVDISTASEDGGRQERQGVPLRMVREREIWKAPYEELEALLR